MSIMLRLLKNVVGDENYRAEDCFKYLQSMEIQLCDSLTGAEIEAVGNIGLPMVSDLSKKYSEYCLEGFEQRGIIDCNIFDPAEVQHPEL